MGTCREDDESQECQNTYAIPREGLRVWIPQALGEKPGEGAGLALAVLFRLVQFF
jgi:hypothetical protein